MDPVPEQIRMVRFDLAGTVGLGVFHLPKGTVAHGLGIMAIPQARGTEERDFCITREPEDFQHVMKRPGHRLVDEYRLASLNHWSYLFQVRPAIYAFQQNAVNVLA